MRRQGHIDAEAKLPEGLALTFVRVPDGCRRRWKLALARENFFPTSEEIEACCLAFQIPLSVMERRSTGFVAHPKSGRRIHVHQVELTWHEDNEATSPHETPIEE
jgi:hypothetical protein